MVIFYFFNMLKNYECLTISSQRVKKVHRFFKCDLFYNILYTHPYNFQKAIENNKKMFYPSTVNAL